MRIGVDGREWLSVLKNRVVSVLRANQCRLGMRIDVGTNANTQLWINRPSAGLIAHPDLSKTGPEGRGGSTRESQMSLAMLADHLARFPRLELVPTTTPLGKLERLSKQIGREVFVKRDDITPFALGGNKVRKLEFLAADAMAQGGDTLLTAGAIQSNHARQTAAVAAHLGLGCLTLLENPIDSRDRNYLSNGNRLLLELFAADFERTAFWELKQRAISVLLGKNEDSSAF